MSSERKIPRLDHIHAGDCSRLLKRIPDGSVDLVVSSPPYNIGKEYECHRSLEDYLSWQSEILAECVRTLRDTGSVFWQVGSYSRNGIHIPLDVRFFPILEDLGMIPRNRISWVRQHGVHARRKFSCRHETILWFTKTDEYTFNLDAVRVPQKWTGKKHSSGPKRGQMSCNPKGKNPGDVWFFQNVNHNHEEKTVHPCQFPEDLVARIVLAASNANGTVLDPFMGTGTVAVVAASCNRHFIGAEIDKTYRDIAKRRLIGIPDKQGRFTNLKSLRDYAENTQTCPADYSFDVQNGSRPTSRKQSRKHSENHHSSATVERLSIEEDDFASRWKAAS